MKTIINTSRRLYWFDENYILHEITDPYDVFYDVQVFEPVNEGQFRNLYITTNNYRAPKRWDGVQPACEDLGGLFDIGVVRARTMEINNSHVIFGNIAKNGGGPGASNPIDSISDIIDTVTTIIDAYGFTEEQGYKRFNKTVIWSDINRPEYYLPEANNQAGDLDFDETGDEIIRIRKLAEFNVVYKEKSIWLLIHVGLPFVYVKKFVTESAGLVAVNAIVEINNVHYFIGSDFDIYRFDGVNTVNISSEQDIRGYIISNIDKDYKYETHATIDVYRKEIEFHFHGKTDHTKVHRDFAVIFNYEKQLFSKRDSVAKCGGYFEQTPTGKVIDDILNSIDTIGITIDNFLPLATIDSRDVLIDDVHELIDDYKVESVPKWKLLIGDRTGKIYLYNQGDSFNNLDIDAEFETGDEDYAEVSRGNFSDHIKLLKAFQLLIENQGINKNLEVYIGERDYFDRPIKWHGPFLYKQDASGSAILKTRAFGVYQRFKIKSRQKNQFVRILGYVPEVDDYGEIGR